MAISLLSFFLSFFLLSSSSSYITAHLVKYFTTHLLYVRPNEGRPVGRSYDNENIMILGRERYIGRTIATISYLRSSNTPYQYVEDSAILGKKLSTHYVDLLAPDWMYHESILHNYGAVFLSFYPICKGSPVKQLVAQQNRRHLLYLARPRS